MPSHPDRAQLASKAPDSSSRLRTFLALRSCIHGGLQHLWREQVGGEARHQGARQVGGRPLGAHALHHVLAGCKPGGQAGRPSAWQGSESRALGADEAGVAAAPLQQRPASLDTRGHQTCLATTLFPPASASLKGQPNMAMVDRPLKMWLSFCSSSFCRPARGQGGQHAGRGGGQAGSASRHA